MGNVLVNEASLQAIADAIRVKNGSTEKYLPSEMPNAIEGIQSGGEDLFQYARSLTSFFRDTTLPDGYELNVDVLNIGKIENASNRDISYAFRGTKGIKKIILKCDTTELPIASSYAFNKSDVEEVDLREFYPMFTNFGQTFSSSTKLKTIRGELDFSRIKTGTLASFTSCTSLVDLELAKNTLFVSFNIAQSPSLSDATIDSIVNGFADMTGQTAIVLTVHKDVKARIEANQTWLSTLTSKNVTLA